MIPRRRSTFPLLSVVLLAVALPSCRREDPRGAARLMLDGGRPLAAARALEPYVETHPGDVEARLLLGRAYAGLSNFPDAHRELRAALTIAPDDLRILDWEYRTWRDEARRHLDRGSLDRMSAVLDLATTDLRARLEEHSETAILHQWLGNFELLRFRGHVASIRALLEATFDPSDIPKLLGSLYRYVLASREAEEAARARVLAEAGRNPSFAGQEALEREMAGARKSFAATITSLQRALDRDPTLSTSAYALASIHFQVGRIPEARAACEALLRIPATGENAALVREDQLQGHLAMADILLREKDHDGALAELRGVLATGKLDDAQALAVLRRICHLEAQLERYEDLRRTVDRIREMEPEDVTARMHEGIIRLYLDHEPWQTILLLKDLPSKVTAGFALASEALARAQIEVGDLAAAVETLNRVLRERPGLTSARALRAHTYRLMGWLDSASRECRAILRDHPTDTGVQDILCQTCRCEIDPGASRYDDIEAARDRLRRFRNDQGARFQLVTLLAKEDRTDEAIAEAETLARAFPENYLPAVVLGRLLLRAGRTREALRRFQEASRLRPEIPDGFVGEARCLLRETSFESAFARLRAALRLDPGNREALLLLADAELARHNPRGARAALSGTPRRPGLARLAPDDPETRSLEAELLRLQGEPRAALARFERILGEPGGGAAGVRARLGRVRCLRDLGLPVAPVRELFAAPTPIEAMPVRDRLDEGVVVEVFASMLAEGDTAGVFAIMDRFREGPDTLRGKLLGALAAHQKATGETDAAEALCRAGLRLLPEHPGMNRLLGEIALEGGRNDLAILHLSRAAAAIPTDLETRHRQVDLLFRQGKSLQALKALQRALKFARDDTEAWERVAFLLDPRRPGAVRHPKVARTMRKMARSSRPTPLVFRLMGYRQLGIGETSPSAREALFRTGIRFLDLTDRLAHGLVGARALLAIPPSSDRAGQRARASAPVEPSRAERRVLAGALLASGFPREALGVATRLGPGESPGGLEELDRHLLGVVLLDAGEIDAARTLASGAAAGAEDEAFRRLPLWIELEAGRFDAARAWVKEHTSADEQGAMLHLVRILEGTPIPGFSPPRAAARAGLFARFPILWVDAIREARDMARHVPSNPIPYLLWASILRRAGDARLAAEVLTESMERSPTHVPTVLSAAATAASRGGDKALREAARIVRKGLDFSPESPALVAAWADVQCRLARRAPDGADEAIRGVRRALDVLERTTPPPSRELVRMHRRMAKLQASRKQWKSAEEHDREAIHLDAGLVPVRRDLVELLLHDHRPEEAIVECAGILDAAPGRPEGRLLRARALKAAGREDEAQGELRSLLARFPFHPPAYALAGDLLEGAGSRKKALAWYDRAAVLDPGLWRVQLRAARIRLELASGAAAKDPEAALELEERARYGLSAALTVLPEGARSERREAVLALVGIAEKRGRPEEVVRLGKKFFPYLEGDAGALVSLGRAYVKLEKIEEAERILTKSAELDGRDPRVHFYLAEAFRLRSADREARKQYQKALDLEVPFPERDEARRRLRALGPSRSPSRSRPGRRVPPPRR